MGSQGRNLFAVFIFLILFMSNIHPLQATRPLNREHWMKRRDGSLLESLQRGPVPPSGRSGCTNVPNNSGGRCPLNERNFAVRAPPVAPYKSSAFLRFAQDKLAKKLAAMIKGLDLSL